MNFLKKNQITINILLVILEIANITINVFINYFSQQMFKLMSKHNIISIVIFLVLLIIIIVLNLKLNNSKKVEEKQLQKVFCENGGYEVAAKEMIKSMKNGDYQNIKEIKKAIKYIER